MGCTVSRRSAKIREALISDGTRDSELQALFLSYDTRIRDGRLDVQEAGPLLQAVSVQLASVISGGVAHHAIENTSAQWASLFADGELQYVEFRALMLELKSDILACVSDAASSRPGEMPDEMNCLFNDVAWRQTKRMLAESSGLTAAALVPPGPAEPQMVLRELWHGVGIPVRDADLPDKTLSALKRLQLFLAQRVLPAHTLDDTWASRERAIELTTRAFSPYARALSNHSSTELRDWVSDAGTGAYGFQAQGCVNLERMSDAAAVADPDGAAFVHRAMHFARYNGVAGTHRLGCDTYFSSARLPVRIELSDGRVLRPVGAGAAPIERHEWEDAKYMFRSMLFYQNNVSSHFIRCHLFASNCSVIAARKHLGPDHPIRRLLHPFQWGTIPVNSLASNGLFTHGGIVHRNGWAWEGGLLELCKDVLGSMRRTPFPREMEERGLSALAEGVYPLAEDGALIWATFESFTRQYFKLHRLIDDEGGAPIDDATRSMWAELQALDPSIGKVNYPPLHKWAQVEEYATWLIFTVTAYHEHVGNAGDTWHDPYIAGALPRGLPHTGPQLHALNLITKIATGMKLPSLLEDFSHVMQDEPSRNLVKKLQEMLRKNGDTIDERNCTRPLKFNGMHPKYMEVSCSI